MMDSSDTPRRAGNFQSVWLRAHEKLTSLEAARRKVDEEVMDLEKRLNRILDYLTGSNLRRERARKLVTVSMAMSAASCVCYFNPELKHAQPISLVVGIGSLAWTLYNLKDVWFIFDGFSKSSVLREILLPVQETVAVPEISEVPGTSTFLEAIPGTSASFEAIQETSIMSDVVPGTADDILTQKDFLDVTFPDDILAKESMNSSHEFKLEFKRRSASIF